MSVRKSQPISRPPAISLDPRRWSALALVAVADFVVILNATTVNIALPSIGHHLHASTATLPWVISAFGGAIGLAILAAVAAPTLMAAVVLPGHRRLATARSPTAALTPA